MKEHLPATFNFSDMNAANPPNQLKFNKFIQVPDEDKWLQGMSNELGRLTQGFSEIKGNNAFSLFQRTMYQKEKQLLGQFVQSNPIKQKPTEFESQQ